jgi:HEAT repeat protein
VKSFSAFLAIVLVGFFCHAGEGPFKAESLVLTPIEPCGTLRIDGTEFREWKDPYGHAVQAKLVALAAGLILLERGEETAPFPLAGLSNKDRDYVRAVFRSAQRDELFPGVSDPRDEAAKLVLSEVEWQAKIDAWTKVINSKKRALSDACAARNHLRNIRDPRAFKVLVSTLPRNPLDRAVTTMPGAVTPPRKIGFDAYDIIEIGKTARIAGKRTNDAVRTALVEAIGKIGKDEAVETLVKAAVTDKSGGVRAAAVWAICNLKNPKAALPEYAKYLRKNDYRDAALTGLFATDLIGPAKKSAMSYDVNNSLIELLVVEQPIDVPFYVWLFEWQSFGGAQQHGLYVHGRVKAISKRFYVPVPCEIAHEILVRQSGYDYGYDRQNWLEWNKEQNRVTSHSSRETDATK